MKRVNLNKLAIGLGYFNYEAYLKSEHWRAFRATVLSESPYCRICRAVATVVHHVTYERIGRELPSDVVALCTSCHDALHVVHRETGVPLAQFDVAAKLLQVQSTKTQKKCRRRKRPAVVANLVAVEPNAVPALVVQQDRVRQLLKAGYSGGWISRRYGWDREQVRELTAWIKSQA